MREVISSLMRGPSLDGGVGVENFLMAMFVSLQKVHTRKRIAELFGAAMHVSIESAGPVS